MGQFTIESLQPIPGGYWKAVVSTSATEETDGRAFGLSSTLTFRFKHHPDGSVRELLQRTLDEARRCHTNQADVLRDAALPQGFEDTESDG